MGSLYQPERMGEFFKARAQGYDEHMMLHFGEEYRKLGDFIPKTNEVILILDIGCGTGIELDYIWTNAPNAHITCLDLSKDMLALLLKNHAGRLDQIEAIEVSYFNWQYPEKFFDIAVSSQTMHHFRPEQKTKVYHNLCKALKTDGFYIENDFYMDAVGSEQYRRRYEVIMSGISEQADTGQYHIDIPCTIEVQLELFLDAGFRTVEVLESHIRASGSGGILKAGK